MISSVSYSEECHISYGAQARNGMVAMVAGRDL